MAIVKLGRRGDTLVEVLVATVVLSIVLAGAYNLSARATRLNQQAFERTQVSNIVQGQSELLRAARDAQAVDPLLWGQITSRVTGVDPVDCKTIDLSNLVTLKASAFYLDVDPTSGNITVIDDPGQVGSFYYIWVEGEALGGTDGYIDFSINACWERQGGGEQQQSGIVTRLERKVYEEN